MAYSNATFYMDLVGGSDATRSSITGCALTSNAGLARLTMTAHGLVTGAVGTATLTSGSGPGNGAYMINVIDANTFDLVGSTYASGTGVMTVVPFGGSSKADAWLTFATGATAARIAPGDTIRVMASPDQTLVGNATWNQYSKTVTLAGAVTLNICDCETAWTGSANVTQTADTSQFKENTKSAKSVIATAFTTGKVAFFATGTLDLSGYQQVSFWVLNTVAVAASTLSIRLCTDTAGATPVHTIPLPAISSVNCWVPVVVDLGSNMNAAIASVALYQDVDIAAVNIQLDNIIACKASSSADALTLTSLIGKVWNLCWVPSSTYASNDIRKPTQPNRNGYRYKVTSGGGGAAGSSEPTWPQEIGSTVADGALTWTCEGLEDTWFCLQSINGTTLKLDNHTGALGSAGRGYDGATETVATYKREPIRTTPTANNTDNVHTVQDSGSFAGGNITFSGGWNRTDMTTKTGETWIDGGNSFGYAYFHNGKDYLSLDNLNGVRYHTVHYASGANLTETNCQGAGNQRGHISAVANGFHMVQGLCFKNGASIGIQQGTSSKNTFRARAISGCNNLDVGFFDQGATSEVYLVDPVLKNNSFYGYLPGTRAAIVCSGMITANNSNAGGDLRNCAADSFLINCSFGEALKFQTATDGMNKYIFSQKDGQVTDAHFISTDGGTIISATDQRHTASGIAWKFRPTSATRNINYPLRLSIAKIKCIANASVSISIWTYRDNTNINGTLKVAGGQLAGVNSDVTVTCAPSINGWAQSSNLTFTPTETGVVEVTFEVYDGVGTTNSFWIDDISIAQA